METSTATKPETMSWEQWAKHLQRELGRMEELRQDVMAENRTLSTRVQELEAQLQDRG